MKKILALAAVTAAVMTMATAKPSLVGHGYFGAGLGSKVLDKDGNEIIKDSEQVDSITWNLGSNIDCGAGLAVNIPVSDWLGIQSGVDFYVNKVGYNYKNGMCSADYDNTFNYKSVDIPLLLTAKLNKWIFAAGPYVSIPVGQIEFTAKGTLTHIGSIETRIDKETIYEHSWGAVGLEVGAGYEQRFKTGSLILGGRYMLDLIPIEVIEKTGSSAETTAKLFRRAVAIDIGYILPL